MIKADESSNKILSELAKKPVGIVINLACEQYEDYKTYKELTAFTDIDFKHIYLNIP